MDKDRWYTDFGNSNVALTRVSNVVPDGEPIPPILPIWVTPVDWRPIRTGILVIG